MEMVMGWSSTGRGLGPKSMTRMSLRGSAGARDSFVAMGSLLPMVMTMSTVVLNAPGGKETRVALLVPDAKVCVVFADALNRYCTVTMGGGVGAGVVVALFVALVVVLVVIFGCGGGVVSTITALLLLLLLRELEDEDEWLLLELEDEDEHGGHTSSPMLENCTAASDGMSPPK